MDSISNTKKTTIHTVYTASRAEASCETLIFNEIPASELESCATIFFASRDKTPFFYNKIKLTWQNINSKIPYRYILIIFLIISCILFFIGTTLGLIGVFTNNRDTDIELVDSAIVEFTLMKD